MNAFLSFVVLVVVVAAIAVLFWWLWHMDDELIAERADRGAPADPDAPARPSAFDDAARVHVLAAPRAPAAHRTAGPTVAA